MRNNQPVRDAEAVKIHEDCRDCKDACAATVIACIGRYRQPSHDEAPLAPVQASEINVQRCGHESPFSVIKKMALAGNPNVVRPRKTPVVAKKHCIS